MYGFLICCCDLPKSKATKMPPIFQSQNKQSATVSTNPYLRKMQYVKKIIWRLSPCSCGERQVSPNIQISDDQYWICPCLLKNCHWICQSMSIFILPISYLNERMTLTTYFHQKVGLIIVALQSRKISILILWISFVVFFSEKQIFSAKASCLWKKLKGWVVREYIFLWHKAQQNC